MVDVGTHEKKTVSEMNHYLYGELIDHLEINQNLSHYGKHPFYRK